MRVAVGSTNKVKLEAVKEAIGSAGIKGEVVAVDAKSGVPDQPFCYQTFQGAKNRAEGALLISRADLAIGIEGGVCDYAGRMLAFAVVYVASKGGERNFAFSAAFTLPETMADLIRRGKELGEATDLVFSTSDSKHNEGAVGHLTKVITRKDLYVQPVIMALYPFYAVRPLKV